MCNEPLTLFLHDQPQTLTVLCDGKLVSVHTRCDTMLHVTEGRLWVTLDRCAVDHVVHAGESLLLARNHHVVIEGWSRTPHHDQKGFSSYLLYETHTQAASHGNDHHAPPHDAHADTRADIAQPQISPHETMQA